MQGDPVSAPMGAMGGDFPKASIGNYKGVMLCNRPNEFGKKVPERSGNIPFNSRVNPPEPIGWNPTAKLQPRANKKKKNPNSVLLKHKQFLQKLELQKNFEREEAILNRELEIQKVQDFREKAAQQREKVVGMQREQEAREQEEQEAMEFEYPEEVQAPQVKESKPAKLNADNLSQLSQPKSQKSKPSGKGKKKPAWAITEKMKEDEKEAEVDELIEFAYDLDYEQYMEDYEVRQALAIIKDRVNEIKQDDDWKQNIADEWNKAAEEEEKVKKQQQQAPDQRSVYSYKSGASRRSNASYRSRVAAEKQREQETKSQWNESVATGASRKLTAEDRIAAKIANEVLRDNAKLKGIHSNASIKKILEKEAKKQLLQEGGNYTGPVIANIQERQPRDPADPSNLPYLHKNPAV